MSFSNDNLVPVGGHTGEGPGVYFYITDDTPGTVSGDGYFDSASSRLEDNALLMAVQNETNASPDLDIYHVENASGDITLTAETFA